MDKIDLKLITLLQQNARMPLKKLAEQVSLSSPSVSARIERLEKENIIEAYHTSINEARVGFGTKAFINLAVSPEDKPRFKEEIRACDNVLECHCVTGAYSMMIKAVFRGTEELDAFLEKFQKYGQTQTQIVYSSPVKHRGLHLEVD